MMAVATVPIGSRTIRSTTNRIQNVLTSPYTFKIQWVKLPSDVESEILTSLEKLFTDLPSFASVRRPTQQRNSGNTADDGEKVVVKALRSLVVVGINQVTRGLERGQLESVVLNKPNSSEAVLTDHLKVLSATRKTPVCVLPGLKERLHKPMKIHSISAIGFKKAKQCPESLPHRAYQNVRKLSQRIQEVTAIVTLPWLHTEGDLAEKAKELQGRLFPDGQTRITAEFMPGVKKEQTRKAAKRKLEETSEPTKKMKVENKVLASPFASEETNDSNKDKNVTRTIKQSIKYQTANIMHILKGNKKNSKPAKKGSKK